MAENKTSLTETTGTSQKLTVSEKFANKIIAEFGGNISGVAQVTDYQRRLIQGYFIGIDRALKQAEERRVIKNNSNIPERTNISFNPQPCLLSIKYSSNKTIIAQPKKKKNYSVLSLIKNGPNSILASILERSYLYIL